VRFVDTSFWVGLQVIRDRRHEAARTIWAGDSGPLVTTNHVLGETWTVINRRASHADAVRFVDSVDASRRLTVVRVSEPEEAEAWRWLRRHDERVYSFVDATSFTVMRRRRIREALAFDGDFAAAGFVEVRAS
jgi:uncharacterized protein